MTRSWLRSRSGWMPDACTRSHRRRAAACRHPADSRPKDSASRSEAHRGGALDDVGELAIGVGRERRLRLVEEDLVLGAELDLDEPGGALLLRPAEVGELAAEQVVA